MLPVEQQDKDEDWFDEIDASMLQFKQKIHGWIRDVERERDAAMEARSKRSNVSGSVSLKRSSIHSSVVSSSGLRSSKSDRAFKEKLGMAELLTEVCLLEERQTVEFKAQLRVEEEFAKSKARVKVLDDLEYDIVDPAILHNSKINIAYNPVNNRNIESGMMPGRKYIMPKNFEAHQQNVELFQAPVMSFHNIRNLQTCFASC